MKFEKINSHKLKITLSCTEILQMNSELQPDTTSHLFQTLLKTLDTEYQLPILNQKILLEMIPSKEEGCNIYLTFFQGEQNNEENSNNTLILSFRLREAVVYALSVIGTDFFKHCALYLLDEMYYLVICSIQSLHQGIQTRLSDLGECVKNPKLYESVLSEYGRCIAGGNTLHIFV